MADFNDITSMRAVYSLPGMDQIPVNKDLVYKTVDDIELKMDVYYPRGLTEGALRPAVILVHGDGPADWLKNAKDWGIFVSLGELLALSGCVAVSFTHRPTEGLTKVYEVADDIDDLVAYVRDHAEALRVDKDALCIWAFSAGVPFGMRSAMRNAPAHIKGIVAYYGFLDTEALRSHLSLEVADAVVRDFSALHYLEQYGQQLPPIFIAIAGKDLPAITSSVSAFAQKALELNTPMTLVTHPQGQHGFDILDDDERSREIIRQTLDFVKTRLS